LLRYWNGTRWTEHTAPVPGYAPGAYDASRQGGPRVTPDGVPLAGWWQRGLALFLDGLLIGVIGLLVAFPWVRDAAHIYRDWFHAAMDTADAGGTVDTAGLQRRLTRPLLMIAAVNLVLGFVYNVGFLMWKQATIGKLAVGLRVRLRERPGPMPLRTVLLRWLGQYGPSVLGLVPLVGGLTGLYVLLDDLWPLWDDKSQALHDKVARTNVVRIR
jgi:uncharacterized RDD family membrane protein YckC